MKYWNMLPDNYGEMYSRISVEKRLKLNVWYQKTYKNNNRIVYAYVLELNEKQHPKTVFFVNGNGNYRIRPAYEFTNLNLHGWKATTPPKNILDKFSIFLSQKVIES